MATLNPELLFHCDQCQSTTFQLLALGREPLQPVCKKCGVVFVPIVATEEIELRLIREKLLSVMNYSNNVGGLINAMLRQLDSRLGVKKKETNDA